MRNKKIIQKCTQLATVTALFFILFLVSGRSSQTNAQMTNQNASVYPRIVHGMAPQVRSGEDMRNVETDQTTGVTVYAQNVSPVAFETTICAQQWTNGHMYHLGCVPTAPFKNGGEGVSRFDFNVWPVANKPGSHSMVFTYRDLQGNWREILSPQYRIQNTAIQT